MLNVLCSFSYLAKVSVETFCYLSRLTAFFNALTTQGLNKGGEIFESCKIQYLGLR